MNTNTVRIALRAGRSALGCFLGLGSPLIGELLAHMGFDWLVIETEHNAVDSADVQHMLMAMSGTSAIPLVRVPAGDPPSIQRALDLGAMGIVVPMVKTVEQARAIVSATRYPPDGERGFGPLRASRYTLDYATYLKQANDNILVVLILETKEAIADLEAIMAEPGVDALYLGTFDLCLSLGLDPMLQPLAELEQVINRVVELGRKHSVALGIGVSSPQQLIERARQGFTMLGYGTDYFLLRGAAQAGIEAYRNNC